MEKSLNEPFHQVPWSSFRKSIFPNVSSQTGNLFRNPSFFGGKKLLHALISEPASLELTSSDKRQVTIHQNRTR